MMLISKAIPIIILNIIMLSGKNNNNENNMAINTIINKCNTK